MTEGARWRNWAPCRAMGFSLIEVVIVAAVAGILLALAVPGYRGVSLRAYRTEAIGAMLQAAACQERIYAARLAYDTTRCLPPPGNRYRFEYSEPGRANATSYLLQATPTGLQAEDRCGTLRLDQLGNRSLAGAGTDAAKCWSGR